MNQSPRRRDTIENMTTRSGPRATLITPMVLALGFGFSFVVSLQAGCGHEKEQPPPVDTCPNDVPPTCPSPVPSYATEVAPIIHLRCGGCHTAGGIEEFRSFDTYQQVLDNRFGMLSQLSQCLMPPFDQPQPTAAERQAIFGWIKCDSPDN
jgi:hypothetical protein